jgi:ABC-type transport system substrate-binding protein
LSTITDIAGVATPVSAQAAKVLRVGILTPINVLDPRDAVETVSALVLRQIFETPYGAPANEGGATPRLFEPLQSEDSSGTKFSAALVPGTRFSDGTVLTPEIAARSLRGSSILAKKLTIDVRGDRLWFTLAAPNPRFDLTLTHPGVSIVLDKGLQFHGTGPFMFDHRPNLRLLQSGGGFQLRRNPHYRGTTTVEGVHFVILPSENDGTPRRIIDAMRAGTIDLTTVLSVADVNTNQLTGFAPVMRPANSTAILFMNTEKRALATSEARRGIAEALDLHAIAASCYERNPAAFIATEVLPPSMGRRTSVPHGSRVEAMRLVDRSGLKGSHLSLVVPWAPRPHLPKPLLAAQLIQRQLAAVGVQVSLTVTRDSEEFFAAMFNGHYDLLLSGWIADTPDPADFYESLLWSKCLGGSNHANNSRWNHEPTDAALARFRANPSEETRRDIQDILRTEMPFVPLVYGHSTVVHSRRLRNVAVSPMGVIAFSDIRL